LGAEYVSSCTVPDTNRLTHYVGSYVGSWSGCVSGARSSRIDRPNEQRTAVRSVSPHLSRAGFPCSGDYFCVATFGEGGGL
jgi:hypothetical protein